MYAGRSSQYAAARSSSHSLRPPGADGDSGFERATPISFLGGNLERTGNETLMRSRPATADARRSSPYRADGPSTGHPLTMTGTTDLSPFRGDRASVAAERGQKIGASYRNLPNFNETQDREMTRFAATGTDQFGNKLAFGWTQHREKDQTYYYNRFTGESRWELPRPAGAPDPMLTTAEGYHHTAGGVTPGFTPAEVGSLASGGRGFEQTQISGGPNDASLLMDTERVVQMKKQLREEREAEERRQIAQIEGNVVEGDTIHDIVDEEYPDVVLFFIIIYRYLRMNYRRLAKQLKKAFEKQPDEEVMAILMRENEAFVLNHMGAGISDIQYVEPLEALHDPDGERGEEFIRQAELEAERKRKEGGGEVSSPAMTARSEDSGAEGGEQEGGETDAEKKEKALGRHPLAIEDTSSDVMMFRYPKREDGFENFRKWLLQVGKMAAVSKSRDPASVDLWVREQWRGLSFQQEDAKMEYPPSKVYSLEQLEQDNPGGDAFKQMKNELHERILQLCKARTDTFQLMGYQQREHVRREVSDLKQEVWRLKNMQEELQKKAKEKKYTKSVIKTVDPGYVAKGVEDRAASPSQSPKSGGRKTQHGGGTPKLARQKSGSKD